MKKNKVGLAAIITISIFVFSSLIPVQGAIQYGLWRNINPTQYTTDVAGPLRGVYVRNGGSGSIGAGDGWAVGGATAPIIAHYDGFSWVIMSSPNPTALYNGVNFCTNSGSPGVGLCSPNGDGSDGWLVGTSSGAGVAAYWDGSALTMVNNGLTNAVNLTSVFMACHSPQWGSGCPGSLSPGLTVAVGSNTTGGAIYQFNGNPKAGGGWTQQAVTGAAATRYNGVYLFIDPAGNLGGFAVGVNATGVGIVARLNSATWTASPMSPSAKELLGVFVDQGNPIDAWAVGRGGQVWHFQSGIWSGPVTPAGTSVDLTAIDLVSTSEGWIVGQSSALLHSTTLGSSNVWVQLTRPLFTATGAGVNLLGVSFPGSGNGWAVGSQGIIIQTGNSNCGSIVPSPCWGGSSSVLESSSLMSVFELGSSDAWAGGMFETSSGTPSLIHWDGIKWHRASYAPINVPQPDIFAIYMLGSGEGWAVGGNPTTPEALKWNGNTWTGQPIVSCGGGSCEPRSLYMISGGTGGDGWMVGTGGHIWRYQSGSWGLISSPTTNNLFSVVISNSGSSTNAGWAVGAGGTVLKLAIIGGIPTWTSVGPLLGVTANLTSVYFKDSNHGWIVGESASVLTTTDGGNNWSGGTGQVFGVPTARLQSVFIDIYGTGSGNGDGWAVGDDGGNNAVFAHWNGQSWTNTPLTPALSVSLTGRLKSVYVIGPEDGFAVGQPVGTSLLSAIYHLDPLNPNQIATTTTPTTTTTGTTSVASSTSTSTSTSSSSSVISTSSASSTSTSQVSSSTVSQTSTSSTTQLSSSTATSPSVVTVTVSSSSSATTPLVVPAIPGFPLESIIAGIVIGLSVLFVLRVRRKPAAA